MLGILEQNPVPPAPLFPTPRTPLVGVVAGTGNLNRTIPLPAGIVAGDLMVVFCNAQADAGAIAPPVGWALISGGFGTGSDGDGVYWKIAVGGETSAIWTVADSNFDAVYYASLAFNGAQSPPEYTHASMDGASSMNSPAITPSWGLANNLFCAIHYFSDAAGDEPVGYPTSYSLMQGYFSSGTTGWRVSARQLAAATDNPASVSTGGALNIGDAMTLAVRPVG